MPWKVQRRKGKYLVIREGGKVVGTHDTEAQAERQRRALYASEYWLRKARARMFASRSEAGRYAAHVRWANNRGEAPMTVEQWRANESGMATSGEPAGGIELVQYRMAKAKEALDVVENISARYSSYLDSMSEEDSDTVSRVGELARSGFRFTTEDEYLAASERAKEGIDADGKEVPPSNFLVNGHSEVVPAKHMVDAMEAVKDVGRAIEQEVEARVEARGVKSTSETITALLDSKKQALEQQEDARRQFINRQYEGVRLVQQMVREHNDQLRIEGKTAGFVPWENIRSRSHPFHNFYKQEVERIETQYKDAKKAVSALDKKLSQTQQANSQIADTRREVLGEVRELGGEWKGLASATIDTVYYGAGKASAKTLAKGLESVLTTHMPTRWTEMLSNVYPRVVLRQSGGGGAFADRGNGTALVSLPANRKSGFSPQSAGIHELTHAVEYANNRIHNLVATFRAERSYGYDAKESQSSVIPAGMPGSRILSGATPMSSRLTQPMDTVKTIQEGNFKFEGREDMYGDTYAGRWYGPNRVRSNEQLTTGIQGAFYGHERPERFGNMDSEQIAFALGVMATA